MSPKVSVVMPVYNGEKYILEAIESVLAQTHIDFELIILNDGSSDSSHRIISEYVDKDNRILYKKFLHNRGLPSVLNDGLIIASGKYIARMDQDDICRPNRFEKQVAFLQEHHEIGVCGSWAEIIGDSTGAIMKFPCTHDEIYAKMLFENSLIHPTVMMRNSLIHQHKLFYDTQAFHIEDYDLWSRALPIIKFANIPEPLLQYRFHGSNTRDLHGDKQCEGRKLIYKRLLSRLNIVYSSGDLVIHERIGTGNYGNDSLFINDAHDWFNKILSANSQKKVVETANLEAELGIRWTQICSMSHERSVHVAFQILRSQLPFKNSRGIRKILKICDFFARKAIKHLLNYNKSV